MDVQNPDELKQLMSAVDESRKRLSPFREFRIECLEHYVGKHYSGETGYHSTVNFMEMAVNVYTGRLVSSNPRVLITTRRNRNKPGARKLELATNNAIKAMDLQSDLEMWVRDAMFSIGIIKTGIAIKGEAEVEYGCHSEAAPYADWVSLDDFVIDMSANRLRAAAFMGTRIRVPFEAVMDSPLYDKKAKKDLTPTPKTTINEDGVDKAEAISQGSTADPDEYEPMIELLELWLPREKIIVTVPCGEKFGELTDIESPLLVQDYAGMPGSSPYTILGFNEVPDQIMPLAPMAIWRELADVGNKLFDKLTRQAKRQKTILAARAGSQEDVDRIVESADGAAIKVQSPEDIKEIRFGGADSNNHAMFLAVKELFNWSTGNVEALAGLGAQSDTLGQDRLIKQAASQRMQSMSDRVMRGVKEICTNIAYYLYQDPVSTYQVTETMKNTGYRAMVEYKPEDRLGSFFENELNVTPYSVRELSPSDRLQTVSQILTQVLPMIAPQMQQQGISLDAEGLLRMFARYTGIDELEDFIRFQTPNEMSPENQASNEAQNLPKPQHTTRVYDRVRGSGATGQGKDSAMQRSLMGMGVQEKEANQIGQATR